MWISRKTWNNLKAEIESQKKIKEELAEVFIQYGKVNHYLRTMLDSCLEELCETEKWIRKRDENTGRFKKSGK